MRAALTGHDAVLRSAIEAQGGWLFKHTGDGVCAAFASAPAALTAAVEAQRHLALPVRMGLATGEAEDRGDDYLGPVLNRVARVMAAGHGGQILVAGSTAALLPGVDVACSIWVSTGCGTCPARSASTRPSRTGWATRSRRCGRWTPRPAT